MRPEAPNALFFGALLGAVGLAACGAGSASSGRASKLDDGWDAPARTSEPAAAPTRPLPGFDAMLAWPERGRTATAHPGRARRVALRASPEADGYGRRGRQAFDEGATLLASLESSDGGPVIAHYLMRKERPGYFPEGGDWRYAVVSPAGEVLADGKLPLCARCHAEATREHLFEPLPASP
jgi:hypothetical protein